MNTIKVRRIGSNAKAAAVVLEETKAVDKTNDYLLNYSFDLSLDDHMRVNNQLEASGQKFEELNMTSDQVDNLLDELNELVAHPSVRTESIEPMPIRQMPVTFGLDYLEDDDDDDKSPYLPKRYSILESGGGKGIVGGSSVSPEEEHLK